MKEKMSTMMDDDEDEDMKHCLTLRIWSLNTAMRGTLNDEHFQKGQQVDEWLRQASKGESKMDYTNMDARSTGMFWAMSYMTGQPPIMVLGFFSSSFDLLMDFNIKVWRLSPLLLSFCD
ncbi:hypothetical protein POM88_025355 [Heracleum sosnowskyi]|uniref:Uncharacterized protein n=1 Tax=Heracleum sosnowskyi TaxID=360622 RepID=A0AAD8I4V0_9APIA|nr:hypothetical protein POM88_025355 [Heracleum sosnowskyi]